MTLNKMRVLAMIAILSLSAYAADVTSLLSGNWSDPTIWSNGVVPTAVDNVTINDTHIITLDAVDAAVNNLTVGNGTSGSFLSSKTMAGKITINGDLVIMSGATFKTQTSTVGVLIHTFTVYGNITNNGGIIALRNGSTSASPQTLAVMNLSLLGTNTVTITMGAPSATNTGFNGATINKTGGAKIILGSDMICGSGSSAAPTAEPIVNLTNGIIETGAYVFISLSTTSATVSAGSSVSYINGTMGRGMSNTAGKLGTFAIGDKNGYRPASVKSSTSGVVTGHYLKVGCFSGNANTGSSTFPDGLIDKVSGVRYYKVSFGRTVAAAVTAPDTMGIDTFRPSYAIGDGVAAGNLNLRCAYSSDDRATWTELHDNYPDLTVASDTVKNYMSDTLASAIFIKDGGKSIYFAIARLTGTTENTLDGTTAIARENGKTNTFVLDQNYPNPFNPSTAISYEINKAGMTNLKVYDVMGREVMMLVNEQQEAGRYNVKFNASSLASGIYLYKLTSGNLSVTKKMSLLK